ASAATSSDLLYSTDGGASWSSSVTVAPGGTVLVRQWYDNNGSAAETGASLSTTLPGGFSLNGGSTKVCLNPSTSSPASPNGSELVCASSNEGAVWSGADLQVSPTAGLFGQSNGQTSGILEMGKKRYLNLHQCGYNRLDPGMTEYVTTFAQLSGSYSAGTNASNTADAAPTCGPGNVTNLLPTATLTSNMALDLMGQRYVNLNQCGYRRLDPGMTEYANTFAQVSGNYSAGTNASNTADAAPTCGPGNPANLEPPSSLTRNLALDLLGKRYVNLHQCGYNRLDPDMTEYITTGVATPGNYSAGTNASNTADAAAVCGPGSGAPDFLAQTASLTAVKALDLLDTARGHGYVEYALTAPPGPTPEACAADPSAGSEAFAQDASLTSTPSGAKASSGTITVDWSLLSEPPCPEDPIPLVDPVVAGAGLVAVAGAGFVLYRRRETAVA
ncbi:MAG TPA: hypothetical protein VNQ33_00405, partial [Acidimicrobiales bacterium]|nr:hypothetical protein [Acidimicrobiales bacterium]